MYIQQTVLDVHSSARDFPRMIYSLESRAFNSFIVKLLTMRYLRFRKTAHEFLEKFIIILNNESTQNAIFRIFWSFINVQGNLKKNTNFWKRWNIDRCVLEPRVHLTFSYAFILKNVAHLNSMVGDRLLVLVVMAIMKIHLCQMPFSSSYVLHWWFHECQMPYFQSVRSCMSSSVMQTWWALHTNWKSINVAL